MSLNLVLVAQRQSLKGMCLSWSAIEGVTAWSVFVAARKLSPEELEAAALLGGTEECIVAKLGGELTSAIDDVTPQGEGRFYGVAMAFADGAVRAARFKALPDGGQPESFVLSASKGAKAAKAAAAARPAAPATAPAASSASPAPAGAPAVRAAGSAPTGTTGSFRVAPAAAQASPAAAAPAPAGLARASAAPAQAAPAAEEDPLEARKRAQREARARAGASASAEAPAEQPRPSADFPLDERLEARLTGATQTWDGLRIHWERASGVAAFEVIASDHQIFEDELGDALAGRADFTTVVALAPQVTCVIDNVTAREARGWYLVLARDSEGRRTAHPFEVSDAATSGRAFGPFLNPNRTGEVRAEAEDLIDKAREQWARWQAEQDGGARREARRMVQDAQLIYPGYPAAKALADEMG